MGRCNSLEAFYGSSWVLFTISWMCLFCSPRVHGTTTPTQDFESNDTQFKTWETNRGPHQFTVVNGSNGRIPGSPLVDATLGTSEGKYCIASCKSPHQVNWLFSSCFMPSDPKCTIQFSAFINIQDDEEFHVCTMKQCDKCQPVRYSNTCLYTQSFNSTDRWTVFNVPIGYSPTHFDINFATYFMHPGSFVALDNIRVLDCERDEEEINHCGDNDLFQCNYTNTCIARHQRCDLYSDCPCGEDEMSCETIPPEGRVILDDCNLDDGSCLWYNAYDVSVDKQSKGWNLTTAWGIHHNGTKFEMSSDTTDEDFHITEGLYMSVGVPQYPKSAVLRSVSLKPRYTGDGLCQIRFEYGIASWNAKLQLILLEIGNGMEKEGTAKNRTLWEDWVLEMERNRGNNNKQEWMSSKSWHRYVPFKRVVVDLNIVPINVSYVLQFKAMAVTPVSAGQVMIRHLSLGRECFTPDITITTCHAVSSKGPSQDMCDRHHRSRMIVNVIESGREGGVQTWTVPETQVYRIQAYGARGGWGQHSKSLIKHTRGTKVTATFKLKAGAQLRFLVGQTGSEACPEDTWNVIPQFCRRNASFVGGGGGGGGGATLVYQKLSDKKVKILLVAGGGGGLPVKLYDIPQRMENKHRNNRIISQSSAMPRTEPSHKDSSSAMLMDQSKAEDLFHGNLKGVTGCVHSTSLPNYWGGSGGFGAGGGACASGGHGGGADVLLKDYGSLQPAVGLPGLSFVHPEALSSYVDIDSHGSDGMVEVESLWFCPCAYRCMWKGPSLQHPICLCPQGSVLQEDGISCDVESTSATLKNKEEESHITLIVLAIFVVLAVSFIIFCILAYMRQSSIRNGLSIRPKKTIQILCPCLNLSGRPLTFNSHVLPQITNPPTVMHENSIYNRVTTKSSEQVLNEIPRKHLKLIGELGQGAFGEVFYGLLSHMPMVEGDLPVAVKTLPVVCTEQTEMDFLLEALIVSKFNHPNIVKFIGTCFDQNPHYLILELLEGGDLKSFLHQARPKRDVPSTITVIDLLRLSLDIARGCQHLEEKHFIHRDIAARNCLLTTKGPNRIAKIADFGMARDIYRSDYYKKAGRAMLPVKWMPPEAFLDGIFTSKTDVWSYGILLWEVFSLGHMPYPGCSNEEVMNLVTKGGRLEPPAGCLPNVFDIMTSCWACVAETRPNFGLIISVLERTIQDDETSCRCIPFYYTPPVIHSKRVCVKNANLFPRDVARGACSQVPDQGSSSRHSKLQVNFEKEQNYLEPLISSKTSDSSAAKHVFFPT